MSGKVVNIKTEQDEGDSQIPTTRGLVVSVGGVEIITQSVLIHELVQEDIVMATITLPVTLGNG